MHDGAASSVISLFAHANALVPDFFPSIHAHLDHVNISLQFSMSSRKRKYISKNSDPDDGISRKEITKVFHRYTPPDYSSVFFRCLTSSSRFLIEKLRTTSSM